jgi:hypothetical protein
MLHDNVHGQGHRRLHRHGHGHSHGHGYEHLKSQSLKVFSPIHNSWIRMSDKRYNVGLWPLQSDVGGSNIRLSLISYVHHRYRTEYPPKVTV